MSADQVIVCEEGRRAEFFSTLLDYPREFDALQERCRGISWFGEVLVSYLQIIDHKLEALLEELSVEVSDGEYMEFCNWVLVQGHDQVQALLDMTPQDFQREYVQDGHCRLPGAVAFWYKMDRDQQ